MKKGNQAIQQVFASPVPKVSTTWEDLYVIRDRFPGVVAQGQATSALRGGITPAEEEDEGSIHYAIDV